MKLAQIFRRHVSRPTATVEQRLTEAIELIEIEISQTTPAYQISVLIRAGNLCQAAGATAPALRYYGRAVDGCLEAGRYAAAAGVCRKILKLAPRTVRCHCTLAWISLAENSLQTTTELLHNYVQAAVAADQRELAAKQLGMMFRAVTDLELREQIASLVFSTEAADELADRLYGEVFAERNGLTCPYPVDQSDLWVRLLRAALMSPDQLQNTDMEAIFVVPEPHTAMPTLAEALIRDPRTPLNLRRLATAEELQPQPGSPRPEDASRPPLRPNHHRRSHGEAEHRSA